MGPRLQRDVCGEWTASAANYLANVGDGKIGRHATIHFFGSHQLDRNRWEHQCQRPVHGSGEHAVVRFGVRDGDGARRLGFSRGDARSSESADYFTADRFLILPYKGDPGDTQATVRTEVKKSTGEKVAVNFSLHKTDSGWKAWDVVIDGISYVKSFRTDFAAEIQQKGLDEVISRMEKEGIVRQNGVSPPN